MKTTPLPKKFLPFALFFIKSQWKWLLLIQFFFFGWSLDSTLWPYVIMKLINSIVNFSGERSEAWQAISTPIYMGIALWITIETFFRLGGILNAKVIPKIEADIRMNMFHYVLRHSHHYFSNQMAGSVANKIADMPQSFTRILEQILMIFSPVFLAIIISTTLLSLINPLFSLILAVGIIIHMSICLFFSKSCDHYSKIHSESRSSLVGKIVDSLTNSSNVRLFARNKFESRYVSDFQKEELKKHQYSLWVIEKMKIGLGLTSFLIFGLAMNGFMLYSWVHGNLTAGEVVFIFNTNWNITMMIWFAGLELPQFFKEIGVCKQALSIIQSPHDIVDDPNAVPLVVRKGKVVFDHVSFQYQKQQSLFNDKNIIIQGGQKVGLVGFSGSGKSTFVNLILRHYDIQRGRILIDDQDIAKVTQDSLREQISIIPQDPSLFHRSLMDNIRYGRLDATDEQVIEAAKRAHCHEFITSLPQGYQTSVGERGVKLSGGQRQRIAIARAILKNAPIIILDEATSSLDSITEREIQAGLEHVMKGHTTIVIAHRLSTLSEMDRILVFDKGKIVEDGTHDGLIKLNGHYAKMWRMQAGGFLPEK